MTHIERKYWKDEFLRIGAMEDNKREVFLKAMAKPALVLLAQANSIVTEKQNRKNIEFDIYIMSKICQP